MNTPALPYQWYHLHLGSQIMHPQKSQLANESSICHFNKRHNLVWLSRSVLKPCWPFSWTLSRFPWHKATRSLTTHPPNPQWDASLSQDYPPSTSSGNLDILPVPIYTPGWREAL